MPRPSLARQLAAVVAAWGLAILSACGGGGSSGGSGGGNPPPPPVGKADAYRFLNQSTYGATETESQRLIALGDSTNAYGRWIDQQLAQPASLQLPAVQAAFAKLTDPLPMLPTLNNDRQEIWFRNSITGPDQLRQRVAFALSQVMVVSQQSALASFPFALSDYYDMLARDAFGDFRQLMQDVTLHPAMGVYLNMLGNQKPDDANEHPPRRELRARADAAVHRRARAAEPRRHGEDGRAGPADPDLRPVRRRGLRPRLHRLELRRSGELRAGASHAHERGACRCRPTPSSTRRMRRSCCSTPAPRSRTCRRARAPQQDLADALDNIFNHPNVGAVHLEAADPEARHEQSVAGVRRARGGASSTTTAAASAATSAPW